MRFVFLDTARVSVLILLILQASLNSESKGPRWYLGCYEGSSLGFPDGWHQTLTDREPDPAFCSKLCFDRGYQMAALSGQMCSCPRTGAASLDQPLNSTVRFSDTPGNSTRGCSAHSSESCMNASLPEQENAPASETCLDRCDGRLCLSFGTQGKSYAVYSTLGPYIRNVSLTLGGESVWAGRPFTLEVSGYLAHSWRQPLGIPDLRPDNLSSVQLVIRWTPYFQSSRSVAVLENGFFSCSSVWTFQEPGIYNISVTVSNAVSQESGNVSVLTLVPEPSALEVTVVQRPQDVPSCVPFPVRGTEFLEKVFLGRTSTFKAFVAMGEDLEFSWQFSDDDSTHHSGSDCDTPSDCLTSTVNHTFEKEGIYQIIVNVSNAYNWMRRVISVAVVPQVLSNLTLVSRSGYAVAVGQEVTLEVGLFTTVRPLLRLRASLRAGVSHARQLGHSSRRPPWAEAPVWPGCQLHAQVVHRYGAAGSFRASAEVSSQEATGRAVLPRPVHVYEPIQEVRPSAPWDTALRSGANATLAVASSADRRGSAVLWIVSRGSSAFLSTTTPDWSLTLCLQDEGHYQLQVVAFNPISNASFTTQLLVQDAISGLSIFSSSPKHIRTGTLVTLNATVVTGTNVTYSWKFGANSSLVSDSETAVHLYSQPGVYIVALRAENQVSCAFSSALEFTVQDPVGDFVVHLPRTVAVLAHIL
nr:PREDICTED: polycystin-1-like [Lepisosteus oculatus]